MKWPFYFLSLLCIGGNTAALNSGNADAATLIPWLLHEDRELTELPFQEIVLAATGKRVIPVDPEKDEATLRRIGSALNRTLRLLNTGDQAVHQARRINEASGFVEAALLETLNREHGWSASIPRIRDGQEQRSGYPDIRLVLEDGSIFYLDPKLITEANKASTFRTFYYEPKTATNKINDDARHLLIGISHNGKPGPELRFESWEIIDLSKLQVRLKAEFQASNRDLYQPPLRLLTGNPEEP